MISKTFKSFFLKISLPLAIRLTLRNISLTFFINKSDDRNVQVGQWTKANEYRFGTAGGGSRREMGENAVVLIVAN